MSYASWPTSADVSAVLASLGVSGQTGLDAEIDRAVAELEFAVESSPFLGVDSVSFPVDGKSKVSLPRPMATITSVEREGQSIAWSVCPPGARPIRTIRLAEPGGSVEVSGIPGFGVEIPADVWHAVRDAAAAFRLQTLAESSQLESVKEDSVTLRYRAGAGPHDLGKVLAEQARHTFERYRLAAVNS